MNSEKICTSIYSLSPTCKKQIVRVRRYGGSKGASQGIRAVGYCPRQTGCKHHNVDGVPVMRSPGERPRVRCTNPLLTVLLLLEAGILGNGSAKEHDFLLPRESTGFLLEAARSSPQGGQPVHYHLGTPLSQDRPFGWDFE